MVARTLQLAALAAALLMALPSGWCNQFAPVVGVATSSAHSCCDALRSGATSRLPGQNAPAAKCCCSPAVVVPQTTTADEVSSAKSSGYHALPLFVSDSGASGAASFFSEPASPRLSAGLRLHALLGVWRC
jgi:hypothetical protein